MITTTTPRRPSIITTEETWRENYIDGNKKTLLFDRKKKNASSPHRKKAWKI